MNHLNPQEDRLKEMLESIDFEIDTQEIWDAVEPQLPTDKKRHLALWWGFGSILLLAMLVWIWISPSDASQYGLSSKDTLSQKGESHSQGNPVSSSLPIANPLTVAEHISTTVDDPINNSSINTHTNIISPSSKTDIKKRIKETYDGSTSETATHASTNPTKPYTSTHTNGIGVQESHSEEMNSPNTIAAPSMLDAGLEPIPPVQQKSRVNINSVQDIVSIFRSLHRSQTPISLKAQQWIEPYHTRDRQLILGIRSGIHQNISSYSQIRSIGEFDESELQYERDRIGMSHDLFIGIENRNGWRWQAGASLHQYTATYHRNDVLYYTDAQTGISHYRIASDGTISTQPGQTSITYVSLIDLDWHRTHRSIDFFATIGKRIASIGRWSLVADAGLGLNTLTRHTGYYLSDRSFGFTKFEDSESPYELTTRWNVLSSLEIMYNLKDQWSVGIRSFARWNPNSIVKDTHFYQLKNSQVGIQLSLTYRPIWE